MKEIRYLINIASGFMVYELNTKGRYDEIEFTQDNKTNEYRCPECDVILFKDNKQAINFIQEIDNDK